MRNLHLIGAPPVRAPTPQGRKKRLMPFDGMALWQRCPMRGNPLGSIQVLADHASTLKFIMKGGQVFKSETSPRIPSKRRAA